MSIEVLLVQLLSNAPNLVGLVQKLIADVKAGKGSDPVNWDAAVAIGFQTSDDIYKREGVIPPPKAP